MNWLDIVLIIVVGASALMGAKKGLIAAALTAAGAFIGWIVAGQISDDVGGLFDGSLSSDTWITVITYGVIVGAGIVLGGMAARIVRPFLSIATLGLSSMADKLGGLALGLLFGLAVAGALTIAMARLAYNFELPEEGVAGSVADRIPQAAETREKLDDALTGATLVKVFIDVTDAIPGNALGFVPSDFKTALDILEENIKGDDPS